MTSSPSTSSRPRRAFAAASVTFASVAALVLAGCEAASDPAPWLTVGSTPQEHSDAFMIAVLDHPEYPGCSAAVAQHGQVVWADAIGMARLSSETPLTTDTVFDFASISKHITAMAVLVLVHDGLVSLDAPVVTYLPNAGPWATSTTVTQLIHHTSGLPDYIDLLASQGTTIADHVTQAQSLATLADVEAPLEPQSWEYSNSNYLVLASIVEAVSGEPFADFVEERLFAPADSSLVVDPLAEYPAIAARYSAMAADATELSVGWDVVGDGGVMASPTAMAEWFDVMRTGLPNYRSIADAMLADAVELQDAGNTTYGAGVFITPDGSVWHTGGWEGQSSYISINADRSTTIAVACNSDEGGARLPGIIQGLGEIWYGPVD